MKLTAHLDALKETKPEDLLAQRVARMQTTVLDKVRQELARMIANDSINYEALQGIEINVSIDNLVASSVSIGLEFKEDEKDDVSGPPTHQEIMNVMDWMVHNRASYENNGTLDWTPFINTLNTNKSNIKRHGKDAKCR